MYYYFVNLLMKKLINKIKNLEFFVLVMIHLVSEDFIIHKFLPRFGARNPEKLQEKNYNK